MKDAYADPQTRQQQKTRREIIIDEFRRKEAAIAQRVDNLERDARREAWNRIVGFFEIRDEKTKDRVEVDALDDRWFASLDGIHLMPMGMAMCLVFNCSACGKATVSLEGAGSYYDLGRLLLAEDDLTLVPYKPHWPDCSKEWKIDEPKPSKEPEKTVDQILIDSLRAWVAKHE